MVVAAFITHFGDGVEKQEKALLYLLIYLIIIVKGGGRFSLERLIKN